MNTKKFNVLVLLLLMTMMSFGQDFLPTLNDNYMGINQAILQPASIVDSRFKVDVNVFGINGDIYNNMIRFKSAGVINPFSILTDEDWWDKNAYMADPDGEDKSAYMNQTVLGPSFLITLNSKHAIGFTSKIRNVMNADDISEPLARSIFTDFKRDSEYPEITGYWQKWYRDENIRMVNHVFSEYGFSYATEVFNTGANYMKAGLTVKLLQGIAGAYMQADDFYYYFYNQNDNPNEADYMSWNTPYAEAGVSDNWNWGSKKNDSYNDDLKYAFTAKPSIGLDLGVVYEFRPRYQDYRYDMDGVKDIERMDQNKYLLKIGLSVLDIGRLKYEKSYNSMDFVADFTPDYLARYQSGNNSVPVNTHWMDIEEVEFGFPPYVNFADTINQRGINDQGVDKGSDNEETFVIKLPTAFSLQADVNIVKGLYVNLTTFTALNQSFTKSGNSHYVSNYSLTPRFEHRWFGVSLPIHYNQYQEFNVGLGIRLAFLYFGVNNLFTGLFNDPYGMSVYAGIKIPIWQGKPPADRDGDAVSDARDKCIDTPGIWDFMGCPDTDGDGIPDMDDKCPKDPGPSLTFGCPDRDNDGVLDNMDQCPDIPGTAQFNGCPDTDGDGVRDEVDKCPETPGPESAMGCPDMDADGVPDIEDACPEQFGKPEYNGCPFQDSDGDGIMDDNDLCPQQPGPPENNGCPWTDTDGDGVWDKDDRCPLTPGDPTNFGCPIIKTEEAAILKTAFENLEFETGKAVIRAGSFASLDELAKLLNDKPDWKLHIKGHTDNVGNDDSNMRLSKDRAESTAKYLQGKGIAPSRFIVEWFGETQPIADNSTAEGRQKNRRVEMEVVFD